MSFSGTLGQEMHIDRFAFTSNSAPKVRWRDIEWALLRIDPACNSFGVNLVLLHLANPPCTPFSLPLDRM